MNSLKEDRRGKVFAAAKENLPPKGRAKGPLPVGEMQLREAIEALRKYKEGKANLEERIVEDELWYKRRHWEVMRRNTARGVHPEPSSAWLFNTLMNKHADASDSYPTPTVLPRERGDVEASRALSKILPVILERCEFEQTYSDNWWEKLKHGTAAYGVFWNPDKNGGKGDVDIKMIDLLNIFWEPGVSDIQASSRLFIVDTWDRKTLLSLYPEAKNTSFTPAFEHKQYIYDDTVDISDKVLVADCYYRTVNSAGKRVVHLMKFCGDRLLYASENDPAYRERGYYDHGMYPVVFDTLFPEKGTPVGFGYVSVTKDPQMYIDKLSANILESAMMATKVRFLTAGNTGVNEQELLDWNKPIVHVEGSSLDDARLRQIKVEPIDNVFVTMLQQKIDEMKETAANRDVNAGSTAGGVTAASAIAALQEAGSKNSRDMIGAAYRAYVKIVYLVLELVLQFYTSEREYRINGGEEPEFCSFSAGALASFEGKKPIFDIKVRPEKRSPFSQMSLNETAKEHYRLGAFAPENIKQAQLLLSMMDFEGKEALLQRLQENAALIPEQL